MLGAWRETRRRQRTAQVHWIDALYSAYLTAIACGVGFLVASSFVGDEHAEITSVPDAAAVVGVVAAAIAFVGLRSGSRGGPLAMEAADVRIVLGSPVPRRTALWGPVVHQARFLAFASLVVGAAGGDLAGKRLGGNRAEWIAAGAVATASAALAGYGVACVTAGRRVRPAVATALGVVLVGWSVADAAAGVWSPFRLVGTVSLWPLGWEPVGLLAPLLAVVALVAGVRTIGGVSMERLERRSRLVGQIRFAATLQDLRTVIVLRRQLTQERARTQPWLRVRLPSRRFPVAVRDVRSVLRWPPARLVRLAIVAGVAGVAARMAFDGTSPMIVVAGLALFVGVLDLAEPLGQEVDHPSRRDALPVPAGVVYTGHLPVTVLLSLTLVAASAAVAVLVDPVEGAWAVAAACVVPAALGAAAGAAVSVLMGAPDPAGAGGGTWSMAPPEAAGMRLAFRLVWPPALATGGLAPVLLARAALDEGGSGDPAAAAVGVLPAVVLVFALVVAWMRYRQDIAAWWAGMTEQAQPWKAGGAGSTGGSSG